MSFGDPNNPYGQQPPQAPYGAPQQPPGVPPQGGQPGYGYPQQPAPPQQPYGAPQQPAQYGYPQQQAAPGYGYPGQPGMPGMPGAPGALASWGARVGGFFIDYLIVGLLPSIMLIVGGISASAASASATDVDTSNCPQGDYQCITDAYDKARDSATGIAGGLLIFIVLVSVLGFGLMLWLLYKEGTTGQTPGKKAMGIRLVREDTGQPIGFGMALVRRIAHGLDSAACGIGFLWPAWDEKRQTFADKVMSTVVIRSQ
ncbi:RDD family protein [Streptomyces sp. NPDC101150]|uniref:RDD family protein n=1 Tax=Streptomyces sp. NPDC101150 TaxID=3366114 RepID=UPI00380591E3